MNATALRKVNTRLESNTSSQKLVPLDVGTSINVSEIELGEHYRGNNIWLIDDQKKRYWSGGFQFNLSDYVKSTAFRELNIQEAWKYTKGDNITVGIIDCSLKTNHSSIRNSAIQVKGTSFQSDCIHGTYMAAIINGSGLNDGYIGIAPNSKVHFCAYKNENNFTPNEILTCLKQVEESDIINMSFSSDNNFFSPGLNPDALALQHYISDLVINKKKILLSATGNNGVQTTFKYYPAGFKNVISVSGAKDQNGKILIENSSNIWNGTSVVLGPISNYFDLNPNSNDDFLNRTQGTSVTCALFSSLFALILSYYKSKGIVWNRVDQLIDLITTPVVAFSETNQRSFNSKLLSKEKFLSIFKT